ncbi:MAG: hypothetical protein OEM99_16665 [Gammaproteobacteria bacterium]|nr:hypothetical protein [Gammaproteobacteria bacterium]
MFTFLVAFLAVFFLVFPGDFDERLVADIVWPLRAFVSADSDSGDCSDITQQYLCQLHESFRDWRDRIGRVIAAIACTKTVQATITLHSDRATNRGSAALQNNESLLLRLRGMNAVLA